MRIDTMQMARKAELPVQQNGQSDRQETDFIQLLKGKRPLSDEGEKESEKNSVIKEKESPEKDKDSEIMDRIPAAPDLPDTILSQLISMLQLQEEKNSMGGEWLETAVTEENAGQTAEIFPAEFGAPVHEELAVQTGGEQEENFQTINNMVVMEEMPTPAEKDLTDITLLKNAAATEPMKLPEVAEEVSVPSNELHTTQTEEKPLQETVGSSVIREDHVEGAERQTQEETQAGTDGDNSGEDTVFAETDQSQNMVIRENSKSFVPKTEGNGTSKLVKTTPADLPADLGNNLAARLPGKNGTLTIELEPASLGKVLVKVVYEAGRTSVSLIASNPRTLEILSRNAGEIAGILESKTGQETVIYTAQAEPEYTDSEREGGRQDRREPEQQEHGKRKDQSDSFMQQLRLGLV